MKHGAEYAKRIRSLYNQLRRQHGKPQPPDHTEPLEQLILGILARGTTETKAQVAFRRLRESLVDYNELRVTPCVELAEMLGRDLPDVVARARDLVDALNAVYDRHNAVDLAFLRDKPVRDAREYLRALTGVDEFTAARVVLHSLGGHAIPVDECMMQVFRKENLIGQDATVVEVQTFLEHHVTASEAADFAALMHRYAAGRAPKPLPDDGAKRVAKLAEKRVPVLVQAKPEEKKASVPVQAKTNEKPAVHPVPGAKKVKVVAKTQVAEKAKPSTASKKPSKVASARPVPAPQKKSGALERHRRS
jgi:endonuclease III